MRPFGKQTDHDPHANPIKREIYNQRTDAPSEKPQGPPALCGG